MATTFTFTPNARYQGYDSLGSLKARYGTLVMAGTYTTGGDVVPPGIFGYTELLGLILQDAVTSTGEVPRLVEASDRLILFETGAAVDAVLKEVTSAQATTGTIRVIALGI